MTPAREADEAAGVQVNAIPYPAALRREVTVRIDTEDDLVGPVWGAAYLDFADVDEAQGWWG